MCQCPERGDPHFYSRRKKEVINNEICVNALKGATLISTDLEHLMSEGAYVCVNALKGATLISTRGSTDGHGSKGLLCQCPERGDTHFYWKRSSERPKACMCQCPERGDPHFYILAVTLKTFP